MGWTATLPITDIDPAQRMIGIRIPPALTGTLPLSELSQAIAKVSALGPFALRRTGHGAETRLTLRITDDRAWDRLAAATRPAIVLRGHGRIADLGRGARVTAYSPDQRRDERGRWTDGNGSFEGGAGSDLSGNDSGSDGADGLDPEQFREPRRDTSATQMADSGEVKSDAATDRPVATEHILPASEFKNLKTYYNGKNESQCVELITQGMGAPSTRQWQPGTKITPENASSIQIGTPLATFVGGKYPNNDTGQHAAIFIGYDAEGIRVLDQWNRQPLHERIIPWDMDRSDPHYKLSNDGRAYSVILWPDKK